MHGTNGWHSAKIERQTKAAVEEPKVSVAGWQGIKHPLLRELQNIYIGASELALRVLIVVQFDPQQTDPLVRSLGLATVKIAFLLPRPRSISTL